MSLVIASGWLTSDRWPESTSIVVAFMRAAIKRSSSGLMVRSCFDTAYHDGLERQAATVVMGEAVSDVAFGACTAYRRRAVVGSTPLARSLKKRVSLSCASRSFTTTPALAGGAGKRAASSE